MRLDNPFLGAAGLFLAIWLVGWLITGNCNWDKKLFPQNDQCCCDGGVR